VLFAVCLSQWRSSSDNFRLKPTSQLQFDYDTTTTRLGRKIDMFIFARVESRRMEAGARDTLLRLAARICLASAQYDVTERM